jgi:hypothetical protein
VRKSVFSSLVFGILALATSESGALISAVAHEGHKMECTETGINAMNADIQAMPDGEAKTTAMKEIQMAEDMMTKKDLFIEWRRPS